MIPRLGSSIGGRYRLEQSIGSGGMGEVFRAADTLLNRSVAIKLVHAVEPRKHKQVKESFLQEARISAAIAHPNVVQILDFGIHEGELPFIVMELLEGENLADMLARGVSMPSRSVFDLVLRVLDALRAAHAAGVIHRDLKPENVFLTRERDGVSPKLLDFGISKVLDKTGVARVTTTHGHIVGTPAYMSPEQARGLKEIDQRTDVYSMGVVLYELLSGELPFFSENPGDLLLMIMTGDAPSLADRAPELAGPLSDLVARAMARDPEQRFRDAGELYTALRELQRSWPQDAQSTLRKHGRSRPGSAEPLALSPAPEQLELLPTPQVDGSAAWRRVARYTLLASLALAAAGVAARALTGQRPSEPRFIVVQTDPRALERSQPATRATSSNLPRALAISTTESDAPAGERAPKHASSAFGTAESLAQSFRAQRAGVVKCVNTYPSELASRPKLSLRLSLNTQGEVSEARLSPPELAATPLSQCIESAARALRFAKQAAPIVFDVPLTARKGG